MFKSFHKNKYNRGVTLIELVVVIVIFMVISSITIFNYGNLNSSLSVQNLADDIALSVRKTQGYAIGVRGFGGFFSEGYGIHFTANPDASNAYTGSSKSFVLFVDMGATPNKKYDYSAFDKCGSPKVNNECLEILNIANTDKITGIFLDNDVVSVAQTSTIDILFNRPNPEPVFCFRSNPSSSDCDVRTISSVKIKVTNANDPLVFRIITISNNGQISVS